MTEWQLIINNEPNFFIKDQLEISKMMKTIETAKRSSNFLMTLKIDRGYQLQLSHVVPFSAETRIPQ